MSAIASALRKIIPAGARPIGYLENNVRAGTQSRVRAGPFKGMRYVGRSVGSCYIPKLLGIYERELNAAVEKICAINPQLIIDIGAAEGYYAVGLSLRNPSARIIAFEMEAHGREALGEMVKLNNRGEAVEVRGKCEPADLTAALSTPSRPCAVICDCEGYEKVLLDPEAVPALADCYMLVEMHDCFEEGLSDLLTARFSPTHLVERIWQTERSGSEYPFRSLYLRLLPRRYLDWAVGEWRPIKMSWLWMQPKSQAGM